MELSRRKVLKGLLASSLGGLITIKGEAVTVQQGELKVSEGEVSVIGDKSLLQFYKNGSNDDAGTIFIRPFYNYHDKIIHKVTLVTDGGGTCETHMYSSGTSIAEILDLERIKK